MEINPGIFSELSSDYRLYTTTTPISSPEIEIKISSPAGNLTQAGRHATNQVNLADYLPSITFPVPTIKILIQEFSRSKLKDAENEKVHDYGTPITLPH